MAKRFSCDHNWLPGEKDHAGAYVRRQRCEVVMARCFVGIDGAGEYIEDSTWKLA